MTKSRLIQVHAALLAANLIYGLNYILAKDVMPDYIDPSGFILVRVSVAWVLFVIVRQVFKPGETIDHRDIPRIVICGLFGVAANQLLFFNGLNITTSINAGIIMTSNPILVLIMSAIVLREMISGRKILGIAMGLAGAVLLILFKADAGQGLKISGDTAGGDFLVFLNAASYGLYLVLVKPLMKKYSPITVISAVFTAGLLFVIPFGWRQAASIDWQNMPLPIWGEVAFVVLCTTFLAYLLNIFAMKRARPVTVSIYIYSQPVFAAFFALLLGRDDLTFVKVISAGLIFSGVYLVSIKGRQKRETN